MLFVRVSIYGAVCLDCPDGFTVYGEHYSGALLSASFYLILVAKIFVKPRRSLHEKSEKHLGY